MWGDACCLMHAIVYVRSAAMTDLTGKEKKWDIRFGKVIQNSESKKVRNPFPEFII